MIAALLFMLKLSVALFLAIKVVVISVAGVFCGAIVRIFSASRRPRPVQSIDLISADYVEANYVEADDMQVDYPEAAIAPRTSSPDSFVTHASTRGSVK